MLIVTARVKLRAGSADQFVAAVKKMKESMASDPGVIEYTLCRSTKDPNEFLFYERYENEEAFAYHLSTDHFKTLAAEIDPLMESPGEIGHWTVVL
ncbi:MAG: antibiotic biosynthesis monooxygenase [Thermoleophilia bacterium]|nr:antibiotic biosynthesis monooxygenase [Thermoleophilia bacterium]